MKVVLFCGGLGTRLREASGVVPKPLVNIGDRPIMWHLMKYYAHFGHTHFILCLGYRGDLIKEFFLNYDERISNNFTMRDGGRTIELEGSDIQDWTIQFVDTGLDANIGQRLLRVRRYLEGEELFLANYSDGLSDLPLDLYLDTFRRTGAVAGFLGVSSTLSFHQASVGEDYLVDRMVRIGESGLCVNGGYFALRGEIFDYLRDGEELVERPFVRLNEQRKLMSYPYTGFWKAMDTVKDKVEFDRLNEIGDRPWEVWNK